ncbi:zinc-binding dehydrogenase [Klebsiella pneumoniae]|nr:zinc-binding dehydrogenase [Klebsiella pneumoniae]
MAHHGGSEHRHGRTEEDVAGPLPYCQRARATAVVNGSTEDVVTRRREICGKRQPGLVIECSGANIALKQSRNAAPNGEVVRVGMGFKPLDFSINDITAEMRIIGVIWPTTPPPGVMLSACYAVRSKSNR